MNAPANLPAAAAARRHDGWTPDRQRAFLAAIAEGHSVDEGCRIVGLSPASAYAFRRRAGGAAFAIGWQAALLLARERLADILLARAFEGQTETITRPDGAVIERHRHDNRLAMAMLTLLDRLAESAAEATHQAARLVAAEFESYLDLVGRDGGPARAGLYIGLRAAAEPAEPDLAAIVALARADRFVRVGAGLADEVAVADLDLADRAGWTTDQWLRAEAAGLLAIGAPAEAPEEEMGVHTSQLSQLRDPEDDAAYPPRVWNEGGGEDGWRTDFPPPEDFYGEEDGRYGDPDYSRALSKEEMLEMRARRAARVVPCWVAEARMRDSWFGFNRDDGDDPSAGAERCETA